MIALETAWDAARAGLIDWASVQRVQADLMPRCKYHDDRPMSTYQDKIPLCADCFDAWIKEERKKKIVKAVQAGALSPEAALAAWDR